MSYITAQTIKNLREGKHLTQTQLADRLTVSDKTISKWETGRGLPDITLLEPLAAALGASVAELLSGNVVENRNVAANMNRMLFYVCPICGNVITSVGDASVSCHGITLPPLEAERFDAAQTDAAQPDTGSASIEQADTTRADENLLCNKHAMSVQVIDGEYYVHIGHPMSKDHHISFLAFVSTSTLQIHKLYPEQSAEARFAITGAGTFYAYCNHHGLFAQPAEKLRR